VIILVGGCVIQKNRDWGTPEWASVWVRKSKRTSWLCIRLLQCATTLFRIFTTYLYLRPVWNILQRVLLLWNVKYNILSRPQFKQGTSQNDDMKHSRTLFHKDHFIVPLTTVEYTKNLWHLGWRRLSF